MSFVTLEMCAFSSHIDVYVFALKGNVSLMIIIIHKKLVCFAIFFHFFFHFPYGIYIEVAIKKKIV